MPNSLASFSLSTTAQAHSGTKKRSRRRVKIERGFVGASIDAVSTAGTACADLCCGYLMWMRLSPTALPLLALSGTSCSKPLWGLLVVQRVIVWGRNKGSSCFVGGC
jgi:hypothetical protein